jgi:uncharacterized Fe-S center protein
MSDLIFSKSIDKIVDNIDYSRLGKKVGIKVHFGERGCITYMNPKYVQKICDKLVSLGKEPTLIETNVLYKGSRTRASDHLKVAKEHGFDFAKIDILDGEEGNEFTEVKLNEGFVKFAKLGKNITRYDSMIVIAHFKGHLSAGYGGIFKTIGMGIGSRAGKLHMHANVSPSINEKKCTGCGSCIKGCDFNAITINENGKAVIDQNKCVGCAMCITRCPIDSVNIPFGTSTNDELQKKIVDYSNAVFKIIPKENCVFVNIMEKITKECDCFGIVQEPLFDDIGIFAGYDPVSLDNACLKIADEKSNGRFNQINHIDKTVQVKYAHELKLGNLDYNIIDLDNK